MSTTTTIMMDVMSQPILGEALNTTSFGVASSSVPLRISTSGKWRIWNDMSVEEQNRSLIEASAYVKKYGNLIRRNPSKLHNRNLCKTQLFGTGGEHMLCDPPPPKPCYFLSSGINQDPSFDIALADKWGCRGVGLDPTIDHNSHLHPNVTFHNVGLNTVGANEEKMTKLGGDDWWYSSVPGAIKFFGMEYVDIVKLDCEGCEIAFTRDILTEDPKFLERVGQITIETHATKAWINTTEQLYYFALIFPLVRDRIIV
jgi:hypothetical protein